MAGTTLDTFVRYIRHLAVSRATRESSDTELLGRFSASRDEAAFAALVMRHGPMVWAACHNVLRHEQDVEDAFQATFVVLARRANSIRKTQAVGSWLYGVARRVAMRAKRDASVRRAHEQRAAGRGQAPARPQADLRETLALVDEEVQRLPDRYRAVFVLCSLEGRSTAEAARQLGWKEGTVAVTLTRARKKLRERLARRGVTLSAALAVLALTRAAASAAPAALVRSTIQAAILLAAGHQAAATGVLTAGAAALTESMMKTMFRTNLRLAVLLFLATGVLGTGLGVFAYQGPPQAREGQVPPVPAAAPGSTKPPAPARESLEQARKAADAIKDPAKKARALLVVAEAQTAAGDNAGALRTIREAFELAGTIPEDRAEGIEDRCRLFGRVVQGQAGAGDLAAAQKSVEAIRLPKEAAEGTERVIATYRASAYESLASAQSRAGKPDEAAKTAGQIGDEFWYMKARVVFAVTDARARAGDWKGAREAVGRLEGESRFEGLAVLARRQAEAGHRDEAGKTVAEALKAAGNLTDDETRDVALSKMAEVQADIGDLPGALRTAESCTGKQVRTVEGELVSFPFKERCLVALRSRAGDFKGARAAADAIDDQYQGGYQKGEALRVIARARVEAGEVKGALATVVAIRHEFLQPAAYIDVGRALAKAGDRAGAAAAFAKALAQAHEVSEERAGFLGYDDAQSTLFRALAAAQEEASEGATARGWIAKLESPYQKVWALAGLSEGAVRSAAAKRPESQR